MKNTGKSSNNSIKKRWDTDKPPKIISQKKRKKTKYLSTIYPHSIVDNFFYLFFQKSTLQIPFYVLQYNHNKENNILKEDTYYDKYSYYIKLYAIK